MRTQDIKIGEYYRHREHPNYAYAKALKIIRPMAKYKQKNSGYTEDEMTVNCVAVKCEYVVNKSDTIGLIKYFRPCDLIKCKE